MLFEEFFKKKRIDLAALQVAEGLLFSEFKDHFEQMGEKSFDHTKKYWFNKLRRRFPLAPEIKTERVHIANPLAEQTITDGLTAPATPSPKVGFIPKFRAAAVPAKPVEEKPEEIKSAEEPVPAETTIPKPAFKPRFNPGMVKPKPAENADPVEEKPDVNEGTATPAAETPAAKPGFKPRFNAAMVKPKPAESTEASENQPEVKEEIPAPSPETPVAKPGFKPRFNAAMVKPKPATEDAKAPDEPEVKDAPDAPLAGDEAKPAGESPIAKPAYKPKFNMKTLPKKPDQE
jgi:hypothetical protein